ncbi:NDUFA10 [Cordylochernes scorpioides]|uniref:NADH dehydrogenase [ubiquinone] 1 alpha subcomplex subunit 10, mitochondrial n=1 Tax=Cordylochernes scorpioides TaxID=51811 RepID=A0ABY6JWG4_9ARAC|nr:NDUFA10 [Cordylochernes scorpioides]
MISIKTFGFLSKASKNARSSNLLLKTFNSNHMRSAFLTLKAFRDPDYSRPPPFDYLTKSYINETPFYDRGLKRFDENTKFIVVEGNIGVGKSVVAKKIAEEFDLKYFPEVNMDMKYITEHGYDLRDMDPYLPERMQSVDIKKFYANPYHKAMPRLQIEMYRYRYFQYIDALNHVINSGQGVVLERSHFSDFVFAKTLHQFNYIRKEMLRYYLNMRDETAKKLYHPHLVVYLDAPVDVLMERIKKRNIPHEVNSKVLTKEYLESLDKHYKEYLDFAKVKSVVKTLDWSVPQDLDLLMMDIEKIDFDRYKKNESQLFEWRNLDQTTEGNMRKLRRTLTLDLRNLIFPLYKEDYDVTELFFGPEEINEYLTLREKVPGEKYLMGFDPEAGDKTLFKTEKRTYHWRNILKDFLREEICAIDSSIPV